MIRTQKEQLIEKEKQIETSQSELEKYVKMEAEHKQLQETFKDLKLDYEERFTNLNEKNSILLTNIDKIQKKQQDEAEKADHRIDEYKKECDILKSNVDELSIKLKEADSKNENLAKLNERLMSSLKSTTSNGKKESDLKKLNDELIEEKTLLKSNFQRIESELEESLRTATEREKLLVRLYLTKCSAHSPKNTTFYQKFEYHLK